MFVSSASALAGLRDRSLGDAVEDSRGVSRLTSLGMDSSAGVVSPELVPNILALASAYSRSLSDMDFFPRFWDSCVVFVRFVSDWLRFMSLIFVGCAGEGVASGNGALLAM